MGRATDDVIADGLDAAWYVVRGGSRLEWDREACGFEFDDGVAEQDVLEKIEVVLAYALRRLGEVGLGLEALGVKFTDSGVPEIPVFRDGRWHFCPLEAYKIERGLPPFDHEAWVEVIADRRG